MSCPISNVHVLFITFDADAPTSGRRPVHTGRQHTGEEFREHGGKRAGNLCGVGVSRQGWGGDGCQVSVERVWGWANDGKRLKYFSTTSR